MVCIIKVLKVPTIHMGLTITHTKNPQLMKESLDDTFLANQLFFILVPILNHFSKS